MPVFDYFLSTLLFDFDPHFETFLVTFEQLSEEKGETSEHVIFTYAPHENLFFEVPRAPKSKQNRFQDLFGTTCVLRSRFGSIFGRFWEPFWTILEPKCFPKSIPKSDHILSGVLGRLPAVQGGR